ncbi:hypothetical protein PG991_004725 [Apiospora marii]|uniref:Aminoglycoside phosphotransferase domain-containing protein n=1 Tax=Apiospora marii TaxID=335849 RepID=A0ABR1S752_9PEZI
MEGDQKERAEHRTTIGTFPEGGSLPIFTSTTLSTSDNESQESRDTDLNGHEEGNSIPCYPIFGDIRTDSSATENTNPHAKALDIQVRAQDYPRCVWSRQDALQRATASWLHDSNQRRVFEPENAPCVVCHASPSDLVTTVLEPDLGFSSSLILQYNDLENYAWSFGRKYVVRERQDWTLHPARLPAEVEAARLLRRRPETAGKTPVPVPEVVAAWKEGQVAIAITERARGRTLAEAWDGLGMEERESYARQVGGYVARWRAIRSPNMQGIDGGTVIKFDHLPGGGEDGRRPMRFDTAEQYKERLREELGAIEADDVKPQIDEALELLPDPEPFTLTHGYLDLDHVFVDAGRVTAIVGWSRAAYLPVWAEYLGLCTGYDGRHREWKELVLRNVPECYYGKAPLELLKGYRYLRNQIRKAQSLGIEEAATFRCVDRCDSCDEGREMAWAGEVGNRRTSSARRARRLEEERQRALEKGAAEFQRTRETGAQKKGAAQPADMAKGDGAEMVVEEQKGAEATEELSSSMFFLNLEQERARAQATKAALQRPLGLRPNDGGEGGSHRRTVSAFPTFSINRNRSPLRYKPQDKNEKARRPGELESPRVAKLIDELGFE